MTGGRYRTQESSKKQRDRMVKKKRLKIAEAKVTKKVKDKWDE